MKTYGYAPSSHDVPPSKVAPPRTFENTDLYPAVTVKATRTKVAKFGDVVKREDELGECLVAHFEVRSTLVMFYQSALDTEDHWTVFVDICGCVDKKQLPTSLGKSVVRNLTAGSIVPEWVNDDADTVYRSRRRKLSQVIEVVVRPLSIARNKVSAPKTQKKWTPSEQDFAYIAGGLRDVGTKLLAAKKATAPARKAAVKKAAAPKKAVRSKK